jgi:hypothetical protein
MANCTGVSRAIIALSFGSLTILGAVDARASLTVSADGPGNTYELLEGQGFGLELPDCGHPVRHIREVFDNTLGKNVFAMDIHRDLDDDRCNGSTDRQRNEVKTAPGGANQDILQCTQGQTCYYRWKFKLDAGLQPSPSFFHIHQIKADSGGDEGAPIFTITPRAGSPDMLQFIFTAPAGGSGSGTKAQAALSLFKGVWVEALVQLKSADAGFINASIKRLSDGATLISWNSGTIDTWRTGNNFNRGKWGLYRSLNNVSYLRDETMLIGDWCVSETSASDCPSGVGAATPTPTPRPTPTPVPTATPSPTPTPTPTATPTPRPTTPPTDVEVTPGASAVTASTNDGNVPGNTVDNNLATRWSAIGDGQWIKYDLGSVRTVTRVGIAVYNGNTRQNRFDLQVSTDNATWTTAIAGGLTASTTLEQSYDIADQPARWVRYVGHGSTDPTKATTNSVTEVSVFALTAVVTPTPTPIVTATPTPTATPSPVPTVVEITPAGAAVTASTNDGNVPANTVDHNLATRWSANGDGQWIQYDLGATRTVTSVKIGWYQGNTRASMFDVLVSATPTGATTPLLVGGRSTGTTTAIETYDVTDGTGRYLRIVGHGNNVNLWNSVTEVQIWGQ